METGNVYISANILFYLIKNHHTSISTF